MKRYSPVVFSHPRISACIGELPVEFVRLEEIIDQNIWTMFRIHLKLDEQGCGDFGEKLTSQLNFSQKLSLLCVMVDHVFGADSTNAEKIRTFTKRASFLRGVKEQILHSPWGIGEDNCLYVGKHPNAPRVDKNGDHWQKISVDDLSHIVGEVQKLCSGMVLTGMLLENILRRKMEFLGSTRPLEEKKKGERKPITVRRRGPSPFVVENKALL